MTLSRTCLRESWTPSGSAFGTRLASVVPTTQRLQVVMRVVTAALDVIHLVRGCAADSASAVRGAAPVPITPQHAHPA